MRTGPRPNAKPSSLSTLPRLGARRRSVRLRADPTRQPLGARTFKRLGGRALGRDLRGSPRGREGLRCRRPFTERDGLRGATDVEEGRKGWRGLAGANTRDHPARPVHSPLPTLAGITRRQGRWPLKRKRTQQRATMLTTRSLGRVKVVWCRRRGLAPASLAYEASALAFELPQHDRHGSGQQ